MIRHYLNRKATFAACPILTEDAVPAYLSNGEVPAGTDYHPIPPGKIVRRGGFWLRPNSRFSAEVTIFLISTDPFVMSADAVQDQGERKYQPPLPRTLLCYFSRQANSMYLGTLCEDTLTLHPLMDGHYPPLKISDLEFIGRVIAAI